MNKEDLKLCLKLVKYGYNYKEERNISIIFTIIGVIMLVGSLLVDADFSAASMWLLMGPVMYIKPIYSLSYSHMAGSSGKKRIFELIIPNFWTMVCIFIDFLIMISITGIVAAFSPEPVAVFARWLIWSSLMNSVLIVFMGVCNKLLWQSILAVVVGMITVMYAEIFWDEGFAGFTSLLPAAVISFFIIMGSAGLSCVLRTLLYKKPVVRGKIGKEMMGV